MLATNKSYLYLNINEQYMNGLILISKSFWTYMIVMIPTRDHKKHYLFKLQLNNS